ncbi:MAG: tail fiber protein, partial [Bacteroidales bacterium]|nr:tail fiber protein [Bacteroidales bacterium]
SSELYVRAQEDLILRSRTGDLYLQTADGAKSVQINEFGQVGIGTTTHIDQSETKLTVAGRIHAKEVKVTANAGGADFVFDDDYNLPDIDEVDRFIKANKHLPAIPSAKEMINNGIDLGEMQIKLLQKIEELTLYVIELKKENEEMKGEIENLKKD